MLLFVIITQVLSIPLASQNLSTILSGFAFLVFLSLCYIPEILGGLFQTSIILLTYSLILLSVFRYNYNLTSYISKNNNLLSLLAYIVAILTIFIIFFTAFLFNTYNFDVLFSAFVPVMIYPNAETDKSSILSDNKGLAGIYRWTHNESGRIYIGSAVNLSRRMYQYFNILYLERFKSMYICNALRQHGFSNFSLTILENIDISNLDKESARELILEREQFYLDYIFSVDEKNTYNILQVSGSSLGYRHTNESLAKMSRPRSEEHKAKISEALTGENHPLFGKSLSAKTKALISEVKSGIPKTEEAKAKMSIAKGGGTIYVYDTQGSLVNTFCSARKAGKEFNCDHKTIIQYVRNG